MTDNTLSGRRVLLVEDEMIIAMLLEDMLDDLGCCVVATASRPAQALAVIESADLIEAAVLDLNLDGQMSFGVADALAERGIPFLFATGYGDAGLTERHRGRPVLQKPFQRDDLGRTLQTLFASKQR